MDWFNAEMLEIDDSCDFDASPLSQTETQLSETDENQTVICDQQDPFVLFMVALGKSQDKMVWCSLATDWSLAGIKDWRVPQLEGLGLDMISQLKADIPALEPIPFDVFVKESAVDAPMNTVMLVPKGPLLGSGPVLGDGFEKLVQTMAGKQSCLKLSNRISTLDDAAEMAAIMFETFLRGCKNGSEADEHPFISTLRNLWESNKASPLPA